jgi:hypothetical protein
MSRCTICGVASSNTRAFFRLTLPLKCFWTKIAALASAAGSPVGMITSLLSPLIASTTLESFFGGAFGTGGADDEAFFSGGACTTSAASPEETVATFVGCAAFGKEDDETAAAVVDGWSSEPDKATAIGFALLAAAISAGCVSAMISSVFIGVIGGDANRDPNQLLSEAAGDAAGIGAVTGVVAEVDSTCCDVLPTVVATVEGTAEACLSSSAILSTAATLKIKKDQGGFQTSSAIFYNNLQLTRDDFSFSASSLREKSSYDCLA